MTAVQTPGEGINSETDKRVDVWKTSEKTSVSLSMRKASESTDVKKREGLHGKMYFIDQLLIETLEMFLNESGMSEVCL